VLRELPIDSTVVLIVLIAALATGAGGMLVAANNAPPSPHPTPAAVLTPGPTNDAIGDVAVGQPTPTEPAPTGTPAPTTPPSPTPEAPTSLPPEQLTGYIWPVINARISAPFGVRSDGFVVVDGQNYHDGLDLATWCGDKIRAAHSGTVLYAGRKFDPLLGYSQRLPADFYSHSSNLNAFPIVVVIDDGNGYRSIYVHLGVAKVGAGDVVKAGQLIGYEGATGHATGCHLHYGLIRMDGAWQPVNPALTPLYPPFVRERVDPLLVLPLHDPDAATRFLRLYPQPSVPGLPFDPPSFPPAAGG
jgi:murein DD-endopeptidase MepM/ murein hydrolase activator NlpD